MKKVIFTKSPTCEPWKLAYDEGDTATLKNDVADDLIRAKFAVDFEDESAAVASTVPAEIGPEAEAAAEERAQAIADAEVGKETLAEAHRADVQAAAKDAGLQERKIQEAKKEAEIEKAELNVNDDEQAITPDPKTATKKSGGKKSSKK
ncbi:hypothetical protein [Lewinella sp. JB7]|uniref:hypothetical protein n=1 Tax=Lewinella sp. JB7 TaxID=2962887 RepID=UPI0020C97762|nr:hypothetical protein [Lewinella sp. JB7]MCP9237152.1 hypothetical protein [Lewinella sp. JB7]